MEQLENEQQFLEFKRGHTVFLFTLIGVQIVK